jgi:hypothetical protein
MKRFVALIAIIFSINMNAQRILTDENSLDNTRTIVTTEEEFYDDETVGMTYYIGKNNKDTLRVINITIEEWGKMEEGRSFLLKFKDGSILELKNIKNQTAHPVAGHWGMGPVMCLQPAFIVTEDQLNKICEGEVVKLRFEQGDDIVDKKLKKNKFSTLIRNCRKVLNEAGSQQRDLRKDF